MGLSTDPCLIRALVTCYIFLSSMFFISSALETTWEVEYMHWNPDGRESVVMGINGQFPGPTLRAKAGETLHINVIYKLSTEGVVIHWHGIRQIGTPWADGTASISQCAIAPGESFVYRFKVDKAGTYFYHGHYGMQRAAGLYGSLIVDVAEGKKEPFEYDEELDMILLSDWWHRSSHEQEVDLSAKPMRWIGEPQTLLINGRGQFNCSLAARFIDSTASECKLTGNEQYATYILHVEPKKTYRLRIASSTSLASLNLAIGNHKMVVVEADGNYVKPFSVENMDIYSGESYSVLFTTDQDPSQNYWLSVDVRGREPRTPQGLTILNYRPTSASRPPNSPPPVPPRWDDYNYSKSFVNNIFALDGSPKPPKPKYTNDVRRIMLLNTQNCIDGYTGDCSDGHTKWAINNISLALPTTPYLGSIRYSLKNAFDKTAPPDTFSETYDVMKPAPNKNTTTGNGVYMLDSNAIYDVIIQNANAIQPHVSEIHPWHLHGHDFWVLGYGEGKFTKKDEENFNLDRNPPLRNNAVVFPYGWTAIRFVADNPGVWAFHCHIEPHLHMGMGVVFAEAVYHLRKMKIPNEGLACGLLRHARP